MEAETAVMFQGVAKASAAFRLMQQMGWEEGSGLGKNKQGMKEYLKVRKKQDNAGIGVDQKKKAQANWALNTITYDDILQKLKVVAVPGAKATSPTDSNKEDSDDNANDELETKREEERKLRVLKVTRPQGRYKKREQGKMVAAYSETDLAAILGASGGKTLIQTSSNQYQSNNKLSQSISNVKVEKPSCVIIDGSLSDKLDVTCDEDAKVVGPSFPDLPDNWWGSKYGFVRAGLMGAASGAEKTERTAFHEKDQEKLYKLVQDKSTTGKRGLGIGDHKKGFQIGDGKYVNQKKVWDSCSEDEDPNEEKCREGMDATVHANPDNSKVKKRKRKTKGTVAEDGMEIAVRTLSKKRSKVGGVAQAGDS